DSILCTDTFPDAGECPACLAYNQLKPMYEGVDNETRQKMPIRAQQKTVILPVYIPRRAQQKHVWKGKREVLPIYWFNLRCTKYIPELFENYSRLRTCNERAPIHQHPYMLFAPPRGKEEKQQWFFEPLGYD